MKNHVLLLSLLCAAYPLCSQAAIHMCTIDGTTVYQDTPCNAEEASLVASDLEDDNMFPAVTRETPAAPGNAPVWVPAPNRAGLATAVEAESSRLQSPLETNGLMVGMTDTEVLNLRGWGRPAKITRKKTNGAWWEEWTYFLPADGQTLLQFANGKLANIESPVPVAPQPLTQITTRSPLKE